MNEDRQRSQVEVAVELEEAARSFARATRQVPSPSDSGALLAELGRTVDHLQQVARQLSAWHGRAVDGRDFVGGDHGEGVIATLEAAGLLEAAADALDHAGEALRDARAASGVVHWVER